MAKPNKLKSIAEPETRIPETVNRLGSQVEAAKVLKLSAATINQWLKKHGYVMRRVWVKES
jgi:hypothetical protein